MERKTISIIANRKTKSMVEKTASVIFICCAVVSIVAVVGITAYMFVSGTPAIFKVGLTEILFSNVWAPTAADPHYGILNIILNINCWGILCDFDRSSYWNFTSCQLS